MIEIVVTVKCPDLVLAASALATAFGQRKETKAAGAAPETPVATVAPLAAPVAPVAPPVPAASPLPVAPVTVPAPAAPPAPVVPVVPVAAPTYTLAQIAQAGADLLARQPGLQPQLMELLQRFGAQTVAELPGEQLGAFAVELRKLGATV